MSTALLQKQKLLAISRFSSVLNQSTNSVVKIQPKIKALLNEDRIRPKKPFKKNFIENLFLDCFEEEVLEYPQIQSFKEAEFTFQHQKYAESILAENEEDAVYKSDGERAVATIKKLELTGFVLPKKYNGFGYLNLESYFFQELFGADTTLAKAVTENEECINLIYNYGSDAQKETYLQKLATGGEIACLAHLESEPLVTFKPFSINTVALPTSDNKTYIVSGKKNWVYNAEFANIMIFSANVPTSDGKPKPTIFLIDKNTNGVSVHKQNELLQRYNISDITFDNVPVPANCILGEIHEGEKIVKKLISTGRLNNSVQCLSIMKKLLEFVRDNCTNSTYFKSDKHKKHLFKQLIGHIVSKIYAVESITYLFAGRLDSFEDPDLLLESIILKIYSSEALQFVLNKTIEILGTKAYENKEISDFLENAAKDAHFYAAFHDSNEHLRFILSYAGLKHFKENFRKIMLIPNFPKFLKKRFYSSMLKNEDGTQITAIEKKMIGFLHPAFQAESELLEDLVFKLNNTTLLLHKNFQDEIFQMKREMKFLADLVIKIYILTAILARASRAYCLSVRRQECDSSITYYSAFNFFYEAVAINKAYSIVCSKELYKAVGNSITSNNTYGKTHPIISNLTIKNKGN